ncbi:putative acyltransferase [Anatilimnocola aggregata]|uniref:Putative acyltransferase n=1 Tax=Anatilimnocola aggregata TaxID=2528021 RepID=A0A517Y893_9BACT|nr:GNAT family N-acetyltransferase [Anatilimnocola aggregata]QDU26362.1 putative acyltransferase [Anatilimnocola aggregata]
MLEVAEADEFFVSETLVACIAEVVVGFVSWNEPYITWLYVDPRQQRCGIGRQLLQAALQRIGGEAWTTTIAGNEPAQALYLSLGMKVVKTMPSEIEGYPCIGVRLALPTSRMRDHAARRKPDAVDPERIANRQIDEVRIAGLIRAAFHGVTLGNGIGLWEAQGIDDYADDKQVAAYRAQDEKEDWSRISVADLNRCYSSLSFFDAIGMRFHLPAFLLADLSGTFTSMDILFTLTNRDAYTTSRFVELSPQQREAVRQFLLLRLADPRQWFNHKSLEDALERYWAKSDC